MNRDNGAGEHADASGTGAPPGSGRPGGDAPPWHDPSGADPAVVAALTSLAQRTRELVEAVVLTDAGVDEMDRVAAEIGDLTGRLGARRRGGPIRSAPGPGDRAFTQLHSPITGEGNPLAPPIRIATTPEGTARAEFTLGPAYEGPPDAVHGGVCAAILDHLLGWAAVAGGRPGMTAGLRLRYRRPTPVGEPLVAEAWISAVEGRTTVVDGRILNGRGSPTVEATGEFVLPRQWEEALRS
ncbi:MAG: PaaI family thioesterase [Micromonosporaceae bacterium]